MEYKSLYEEFNIETKKMYHKWFNKYIKDEDEESFKNAVIAMGKTYNVLRTLPKQEENELNDIRENFFEDIWNNIPEIKSGKYDWTKEIEGIKGRHFWSYLSKVCYLISPEKYKIIYDNNNRIRLKELYPEKIWNPKNWQGNIDDGIYDDLVNKYQVELKNYKVDPHEYYFYLDFLLWESN